jgi:BirA family biotin operon repressor/biotin-[acetyl-CoA-carboxylase] ligase
MPVRCEIKWPNDVWVDGRKLAGILVEGRPQEGWAVLGLGLNVTSSEFPPELREIATSLRLAGAEVRPEQVLQRLLETLDAWLAGPDRAVLAAWSERDALRGRPVSWEGGHGIAAGIDDTGSLLVDTPDGRLVLAAGEVHLNRPDRETRGESPHRPPRAPRR